MRAAPFVFAVFCLGVLLPFSSVYAADAATEEARQHFQKGQQFYDLGHWDEAAEEFEKAYAARNDPTFIYNMAQAFRRKGDAKRALELYKNYLIKAPRSPRRPEIEQRIETLQAQVSEAQRAGRSAAPEPAHEPPSVGPSPPPVVPPVPTEVPASAAEAAPAPAEAPAVAPTPSPAFVSPPVPAPAPAAAYVAAPAPGPEAEATPGRGLRIGGIVTGVTGLVVIGGGIFFSLETDQYASSVENGSVFNPYFDDRGKLYEKLQWVCYGLGVGLVATGAILYGVGVGKGRAAQVALVPTLVRGGAGLGAQGVF
jgi:tetratricopeptide (TPR) repeat protein